VRRSSLNFDDTDERLTKIENQFSTLVASIDEKDAPITEKDAEVAELKQGGGGQTLEEILEQVQDARLGSIVLNPDAEGKKFLRFALK
jgi:archaellum component FlaC